MIRRQTSEYVRLGNTAVMTSPPSPPINGGSVNLGRFNLSGYNRVRGQVFCDQTGTCVLNWRAKASGPIVYSFNVPVDGSQSANTYAWNDEPIRGQYLEVVFTNTSGMNATQFTAFHEALPS